MSAEKLKVEHYTNFGGINTKVSPYENSAFEFLDICNYDFQTPCALTQRWGSTQYIGQTFAGGPNSLFEFSTLNGASQIMIGATGGIWAITPSLVTNGLSLTTMSATLVVASYFNAMSAFAVYIPSSAHYELQGGFGALYLGGNAGYYGTGETFVVDSNNQSANPASYKTMDNFLFIADGDKFIKYDGTTTYFVGLPPPLFGSSGYVQAIQATTGITYSPGWYFGASFGSVYLWANYVNNRGFQGPVFPIAAVNTNLNYTATLALTSLDHVGPTLASGSQFFFQANFATPLAFGVSSINIFTYYDPSTGATPVCDLQGFNTTSVSGTTFAITNAWSYYANKAWSIGTPVFLGNYAASGSTISTVVFYPVGATTSANINGITNVMQNVGQLSQVPDYMPIGMTVALSGQMSAPAGIDAITNYYPSILETHTSRLFLAGFSLTPSVVWFSDVAEPEGYFADSNFEVRTDDGDHVSCLKAYSNRLYIWKTRSFHVLLGDNESNFFLQQLSDTYGCLNNRCALVYNDTLLFLDTKGVMMYAGQISCISNKVQPYFDKMNISAALTTACMEHDKLRNQILIAIPINGSTTNNCLLIFDYLTGAWTRYDNSFPSAMRAMYGRNTTKNIFFGSYSGALNWYGSSFLQDNGVGYSLYFKTIFLKPMGDSIQEQYRRLYVNANPGSGTYSFNVNFFQDYGTSMVYQTSLVIGGNVQSRIDFGISARSLAFEMETIQSAIPLQVFGFTVESRLQRRV